MVIVEETSERRRSRSLLQAYVLFGLRLDLVVRFSLIGRW